VDRMAAGLGRWIGCCAAARLGPSLQPSAEACEIAGGSGGCGACCKAATELRKHPRNVSAGIAQIGKKPALLACQHTAGTDQARIVSRRFGVVAAAGTGAGEMATAARFGLQ